MSHNGPDVHQSTNEAHRCSEDLVLEEALGKGGYGVCYRAHYRGATVAVKVGGRIGAGWGWGWGWGLGGVRKCRGWEGG